MVETRAVMACMQCKEFWAVEGEAAACDDAGHEHRRFEMHHHRTPVVLPDGTTITAASFDTVDPYGRDEPPDYGVYLDHRWRPPWPHEHVDWPDFGVPADAAALVRALRGVLDRARAGERVELGCLGGHGRTGTALACLVAISGHGQDDAVAWVRASYCDKAVETADQAAFVAGLDPSLTATSARPDRPS